MPATQILPWPLLKRRSTAIFPVRPLQQLLQAHGYNVAVDGVFGATTEDAVKEFQQSKGLAADGIVGPATWPKLVLQVKKGSTGDAVRAVQEVMRFHDQSSGEGPSIPVDGIFGTQTERFVRRFQNPIDIDVDGIVGPVTWRAMLSGMLSG